MLPALFFIFRALRAVRRRLQLLEQRFSRLADEIERSRLDQRLEHFFVACAQIDFFAELQQSRESPDAPPRFEDRLDRALADAFHGAEAEADVRTDYCE